MLIHDRWLVTEVQIARLLPAAWQQFSAIRDKLVREGLLDWQGFAIELGDIGTDEELAFDSAFSSYPADEVSVNQADRFRDEFLSAFAGLREALRDRYCAPGEDTEDRELGLSVGVYDWEEDPDCDSASDSLIEADEEGVYWYVANARCLTRAGKKLAEDILPNFRVFAQMEDST